MKGFCGEYWDYSPQKLSCNILYRLVDIHGRILQEGHLNTAITTIDLSAFPAGIYWLEWQDGTERLVERIMKQ